MVILWSYQLSPSSLTFMDPSIWSSKNTTHAIVGIKTFTSRTVSKEKWHMILKFNKWSRDSIASLQTCIPRPSKGVKFQPPQVCFVVVKGPKF